MFEDQPYVVEQEEYYRSLSFSQLLKWADRARYRGDSDALDCLLGFIEQRQQELEREDEPVAV